MLDRGHVNADSSPGSPYFEGEDCSECEGTGECNFTCCGDDVNDIGICPSCGEHSEATECEECEGSGTVFKTQTHGKYNQ
jgi:hypothetical protein